MTDITSYTLDEQRTAYVDSVFNKLMKMSCDLSKEEIKKGKINPNTISLVIGYAGQAADAVRHLGEHGANTAEAIRSYESKELRALQTKYPLPNQKINQE